MDITTKIADTLDQDPRIDRDLIARLRAARARLPGSLAHITVRTRAEHEACMDFIDVVLDAMRQSDDDKTVHNQGLVVLGWLLAASTLAQDMIVAAGGVDVIIDVMHRAKNTTARFQCCRILGLLAWDNAATQRTIVSAGGIGALIRTTQQFRANTDVQSVCWRALFDLMRDNAGVVAAVKSAPGIDVAIAMLRDEHPAVYQRFRCDFDATGIDS